MKLSTRLSRVDSKEERIDTLAAWLEEQISERTLDADALPIMFSGVLAELKQALKVFDDRDAKLADLMAKIDKQKKERVRAECLREIGELLRCINEVFPSHAVHRTGKRNGRVKT